MEAMEWVMRPPRYIPMLAVPLLILSSYSLVVLTPGGWMFGTTAEAVLWTVLPIFGIGCPLYFMTAKVVIDPSGVRVTAFPRWRFFPWDAIETVETKTGTGLIPLVSTELVLLRVRGRRRPVKLWQIGGLAAQNPERDAFIEELRRRFRMSRDVM